MKIHLLLLVLALVTLQAQAEMRTAAISCHAVMVVADGIQMMTGEFTYSLHTGLKDEEVHHVSLEKLLPKLVKVKNTGSGIDVAVFSDRNLGVSTLKVLIDGISAHPHMDLVYMENGMPSKNFGKSIRDTYTFDRPIPAVIEP